MAAEKPQPVKILVAGDVKGDFQSLFSKVDGANKQHGPFSMLICVGEFFAEINPREGIAPWLEGKQKIPIPTYFVAGKFGTELLKDIPDGGDLVPGLNFLGPSGTVELHGLRVAYLSGIYEPEVFGTKPDLLYDGRYRSTQVGALLPAVRKGVFDILMTCEWPAGFAKSLPTPPAPPVDIQFGSQVVFQLAMAAAPRYHFCGTHNVFYARPPYVDPLKQVAVRLIGVASVPNPAQKWLYACQPVPANKLSKGELSMAAGATPAPYEDVSDMPMPVEERQQKVASTLAFAEAQSVVGRGFTRWEMSSDQQKPGDKRRGDDGGRGGQRGGRGGKRGKFEQPPIEQDCWFCLSSKHVQEHEQHLIVSVGTQVYVAMAKGGLTNDHCLIVPIPHIGSSVDAGDDLLEECEKYKASLRKLFESEDKVVVIFERAMGQSRAPQHMHFQVLAVPASMSDLIRPALSQAAEFHEVAQDADYRIEAGVHGHLLVELPQGIRLLAKGRPPVTLAREVLASVMGIPQRADWRACALPKTEEEKVSQQFRERFAKFDWSLE